MTTCSGPSTARARAPPVAEDPLAAFRAARRRRGRARRPRARGRGVRHPDGTDDGRAAHRSRAQRRHGPAPLGPGPATGQDDTIDPEDVERLWASTRAIPAEVMERYRTPGAFGPGIEVLGPEVQVPEDAPLQHRLLGLIGREPEWQRS